MKFDQTSLRYSISLEGENICVDDVVIGIIAREQKVGRGKRMETGGVNLGKGREQQVERGKREQGW